MAPEHERPFSIQEYHSTLLKCRIGLFWALAQRSLGDDKAHPFRSFRRRMSPNSHYFLEFSSLYK